MTLNSIYNQLYHGTSIVLTDYEALFNAQDEAILVNDLVKEGLYGKGSDGNAKLSSLVKTEISVSNFKTTPKCSCNYLNTRYDADMGNTCPKCGTRCVKSIYMPIRERLWISAVNPVRGFIHPRFWLIFNKTFSTFNIAKHDDKRTYFDLMGWMCDPNYRNSERITGANLRMINFLTNVIGYKRGINEFILGFDALMERLLDVDTFTYIQKDVMDKSRQGKKIDFEDIEEIRRDFKELISRYRDRLFPQYLPLISEQMIITEESTVSGERQIDEIFLGIIDSAKSILSIYSHENHKTFKQIAVSRCVSACRQHATFNYNLRRAVIFPKSGIVRSKANKTRTSFSGRATISAIPWKHKYDHCIPPWRWTVNLLYLDLLNLLLNRHDFTPTEAIRLIDYACVSYHPFVHELIKTLIAESPDDGIMLLPLRNPTLVRLSVWVMYIIDVKTDVDDGSISISNKVIKAANADYDGDQIQVQMPRDNRMRRLGKLLRPPMSAMSRVRVGEVASELTLHPENVANQYGFIQATVTDNEWDFA